MKRTTIMLSEELRARVSQRARELEISMGEYIRRSLESALANSTEEGAADSLLADDAVFEGATPEDLAAEHDRYLYEEEL